MSRGFYTVPPKPQANKPLSMATTTAIDNTRLIVSNIRSGLMGFAVINTATIAAR
jgi:hypothetical protein